MDILYESVLYIFVDFTLVRDDIWNETDIEKYEYYFHNLVTEYIKVLKQGKTVYQTRDVECRLSIKNIRG